MEIVGLPAIVGQQGEVGEAGPEMLIGVVLGTRQQSREWTTRPAAVTPELLDESRDSRRVGGPERLDQRRGLQVSVNIDPAPGRQGDQDRQASIMWKRAA